MAPNAWPARSLFVEGRVGCALRHQSAGLAGVVAAQTDFRVGLETSRKTVVVSEREIQMKGARAAQTRSEGPALQGRPFVALTDLPDAVRHPYQTTVRADLSRRREQEVRNG